MRTVLHYPALVEDIYHVCLLDRGQSMRYGDCRPAFGRGVKSCLNDLLGLGVQSTGRFVEQEYLGVS